jgi:hypothetical protein
MLRNDLTPDAVMAIARSNGLTEVDVDWIIQEIEALRINLDNPPDNWMMANPMSTQDQVGYLAGAMDLERPARIVVLSLIVGFDCKYSGEYYEGAIPLDQLPADKQELYPGPSSKDVRITRYERSILIDYYLSGNGKDLNAELGFTPLSTIRQERAIARAAARQIKTLERERERERKRLEREARKAAKTNAGTGDRLTTI